LTGGTAVGTVGSAGFYRSRTGYGGSAGSSWRNLAIIIPVLLVLTSIGVTSVATGITGTYIFPTVGTVTVSAAGAAAAGIGEGTIIGMGASANRTIILSAGISIVGARRAVGSVSANSVQTPAAAGPQTS